MPGVKINLVPFGLERTILGTLSEGCKVTCVQLSKLSKKNATGWRIMRSPKRSIACPALLAKQSPLSLSRLSDAGGNRYKPKGKSRTIAKPHRSAPAMTPLHILHPQKTRSPPAEPEDSCLLMHEQCKTHGPALLIVCLM